MPFIDRVAFCTPTLNYHIVTVEKWTTISSQSEFFSCPRGNTYTK